MTMPKNILIVGLQPELIDFSSPEFSAFPGLNAAKVMEGLNASAASLVAQGHESDVAGLLARQLEAETRHLEVLQQRRHALPFGGVAARHVKVGLDARQHHGHRIHADAAQRHQRQRHHQPQPGVR